jgi:ABC-type dipeptide/oligopeptide/nickel transport system permease component
MWLYVLKRFIWFLPTLFAVTLIGFVLLANAPGDAVDSLVLSSNSGGSIKTTQDLEQQKIYWRKQLGLNLPSFYFSISTLAEPDTLYKVYDETLLRKIKQDIKNKSGYKNYLPKIIWHGYHNQYHRWLFGGYNSKGIIRGDFGLSISKKEPVVAIIKDKLIYVLRIKCRLHSFEVLLFKDQKYVPNYYINNKDFKMGDHCIIYNNIVDIIT